MSGAKGWIGVDFDGTLAHYDGWKNGGMPGRPIPLMVERVKAWLAQGIEVRVVTARVANRDDGFLEEEAAFERHRIKEWCKEHIGRELPVTASKDMQMLELWDDRAVQVVKNTGERVGDQVIL